MKLYLVRHGDYVQKDPRQKECLSEKGIADIQKIAKFLAQANVKVNTIWHSGKLRAEQTALILSETIASKDIVRQEKGLLPMDDVKIIQEKLLGVDEDLMLVGHLPYMGELLSTLISNSIKYEIVDFVTGTIVCLQRSYHEKWIVNWTVNPLVLV